VQSASTEEAPEASSVTNFDAAEEAPVQSEGERKVEELSMLLLGFGTGLSIAAIFLIYIVFEYARFLP
jgi:hypothetical protein